MALTLDLPLTGCHQLSVDINCKQRTECKAKGVAQLIRVPLDPQGFPCGSASKESACSVGDLGSIPGLGRSPGEGNSYPLQYSGLENSMDYTVHGVAKSQIQLSDFHLYPYAAAAKLLQLCPTLRAHRRQPTRLLHSWDSPGRNTGVGLPCPSPGDLPNPGIKPRSPALRADTLPSEPPGKPKFLKFFQILEIFVI